MKPKNIYNCLKVLSLLVPLLLFSCQKEEPAPGGDCVAFHFSKSAFTRADLSDDGSGTFADGDKIALYARSASGEKRFTLTLQDGRWTPAIPRSELGSGSVTLAAYSPVADASPASGEAYAHTLRSPQKEKADYAASDLLFSSAQLDASSREVAMTFSHAMHRVDVALKAAGGGELPGNLRVEVLSRTQGRVSASEGTAEANGPAEPEWIEALPLGGNRYTAIVYPDATDGYAEAWIRVGTEKKSAVFGIPADASVGPRLKEGHRTSVTLTVREAVSGTGHWLRFDANGGEGRIDPVYLEEGEQYTLPSGSDYFTKFNSRFAGYALTNDGLATLYPGNPFTMGREDVTLYAVWYIENPGLGGASEVFRDTTVWLKGVRPPREEDWKLLQPAFDNKYTYVWSEGCGWYNVNQSFYNFCWAATCCNILHWWLDQNADYVKRFGYDGPCKYGDQYNSEIFYYFRRLWPNEGNWTQYGFQWFINGNAEIKEGGFFKEVFAGKTLYDEYYSRTGKIYRSRFTELCDRALRENMGIGLISETVGRPHEFTIWGVEFDEEGYVRAIYRTNSADSNYTTDGQFVGIRRSEIVYDENLIARIPSSMEGYYVRIFGIQIYSLGREHWEEYFRTHPDK